MPVFALYNFDDTGTGTLVQDSAGANGAQQGFYWNGATNAGGQAILDGQNDIVKIYADPAFQLDRGTLNIQFTLADAPLDGVQTVLSRDSVRETDGGYRIEINPDGSVLISHETRGGTETFGTAAGFANPGDEINLTYSWDQGGTGGSLQIGNLTTNDNFAAAVPASLTMDQGGISQPWLVGAGQSLSEPNILNNINQHFEGSVAVFSISDTVDNTPDDRDGIVTGTAGGDLIDVDYLGDPDGDVVDGNDALIPGDAPNDDRIVAGGGNDTVYAGLGDDTADGGVGDDLVYGGVGDDSLAGGDGADTLDGGTGGDTLAGGGGRDRIIGGDGNDSVVGGEGGDTIDTSATSGARPDLGYPGVYPADTNPTNDLDTVYGGAGNDTILTGDDADLIDGGEGADSINGGFDNDTITGGAGRDTIIGGEGADRIDAGADNDLVYGGLSPEFPDSINIRDDRGDLVPNNGTDRIFGGAGNDTIFGLDDADTIDGGTGADVIDAGIDNDRVTGGTGSDTITGGQGVDTLAGGDDRDVFIGANAGDVVDGSEGGDDFDTLDLRGSGPLRVTFGANPENGTVDFLDADGNTTGSMTFTNIENVIPCFTPGTMIATPKGEVAVELLKAGDRIITRDNGIQEIRWTGQKALNWHDLNANPHLKPIFVRQGSLGNGLPERDMMVSPNHRLLVANDRTALYFDEHEVLVAAKHLVAQDGVQAVESLGTTYLHFMFDRHEVVLSNGAWTESFQPGDYTLKGMGNAQRAEIFDLFPELKTEAGLGNYTAARKTLKRHEAMLLTR